LTISLTINPGKENSSFREIDLHFPKIVLILENDRLFNQVSLGYKILCYFFPTNAFIIFLKRFDSDSISEDAYFGIRSIAAGRLSSINTLSSVLSFGNHPKKPKEESPLRENY
jgi:hypothetical protein